MHSTHWVEKKGPSVRLHCILEKGHVVKTHLEHSPFFEAFIEADSSCSSVLKTLTEWVHHFSHKNKTYPFPLENLALDNLSAFRKEVLIALWSIPFGHVASYGEIAKKIGNPRASRAVGSTCGRNPFPLLIPCHRIIAGDGSPGGFSLDFRVKRDLLQFEARS